MRLLSAFFNFVSSSTFIFFGMSLLLMLRLCIEIFSCFLPLSCKLPTMSPAIQVEVCETFQCLMTLLYLCSSNQIPILDGIDAYPCYNASPTAAAAPRLILAKLPYKGLLLALKPIVVSSSSLEITTWLYFPAAADKC